MEKEEMTMFHVDAFLGMLPLAGQGCLGVFAVTLIIVAAVEILEHLTGGKP